MGATRAETVHAVRKKYELLAPVLSERARRLWAATEALALGRGGGAWVAEATGLARSTVVFGVREVRRGANTAEIVKDRRRGAGRKRAEEKQPGLADALERLVSPDAQGDPETPLRWTSKTTRKLSAELRRQGFQASATKVSELLRQLGYSLQGTSRMKEGAQHPDRDAQFAHIKTRTEEFISRGLPVVSVDAKKKEQVGDYANAGKEWHPRGKPTEVLTYDFAETDAPKAIPYGVYDVAGNEGFVNVGVDHDTPAFAAHSLERWWKLLGQPRYPHAKELYLTCDGGGSNARKSNAWKVRLQEMADRTGLTIHVSHFPPGTSKWNKIEHRLFSFITLNWRGKPLQTYETIIALIAGTTTRKGLKVSAELDRAKYPIGISISRASAETNLKLTCHAFQGQWNFSLAPRTPEEIAAAKARKKEIRSPRKHADVREAWRKIFIEQSRSGLNHRQFCLQRGHKYDAYNFMRRKLVGVIRPRTTPSK